MLYDIYVYLYLMIVGDENKKQLLDLGVGEVLLKLMQSEDRIVRRNVCMVMGVMIVYRGCFENYLYV